MKRSIALIFALLLLTILPVVGAELAPAPECTFTMVVMPDTQYYRGRGTKSQPDSTDDVTNPTFDALSTWVAENLKAQRVVFVTHVGDIVDKNNHDQWRIARQCMDRLHGVIPYGISVGNHDMTGEGDSSLFQEYFGAERFEGFDWYGGSYAGSPEFGPSHSGNNANSYQLISALGVDLLFLHLECNAPDDVLAWASGVLEAHPDRRAIVVTHMGLGPLAVPTTAEGWYDDPKGRMLWNKIHKERGNTPQQLWEEFTSKHPNIMLVLHGDQSRTQAMHMVSEAEKGNTVHEIMFDCGGGRNVRLLRFTPAQNRIEAITWDIQDERLVEGTVHVEDRDEWQFTMECDLGAEDVSASLPTLQRPHPALRWPGRLMFR